MRLLDRAVAAAAPGLACLPQLRNAWRVRSWSTPRPPLPPPAHPALQRLLPQLPHLRELRLTSGEAGLPVAVAAVLPRDCQFSTAGMPREGPAVDAWGRSLHQTAPLAMDWADSLLTAAGVYMPAVEADEQEAALHLSRQVSRVLVS